MYLDHLLARVVLLCGGFGGLAPVDDLLGLLGALLRRLGLLLVAVLRRRLGHRRRRLLRAAADLRFARLSSHVPLERQKKSVEKSDS